MKTIRFAALLVAAIALGGCTAGKYTQAQFDNLRERADLVVQEYEARGEGVGDAAGYVVFPTVGKVGWGISVGFGRGVVYSGGEPIGVTGFNAANIGFTLGLQSYSQLVLLQTAEDVERFTKGPWAGAAQANAVFIVWGASADADFASGRELRTEDNWGLMYEATIGLNKYMYRSLEDAIKPDSSGGDSGASEG
ncbi:MAG: hypothetical protein ACF8R7_12100 [Phycisphaerales bacterium JB039]